MKKLLITSTDVMMIQFLIPHVQFLSEHGFTVDVACSQAEGYKNEGYQAKIQESLPVTSHFFSVSLERSPYSIHNVAGLKELKKVINNGNYDLIWTNEPVMGVMTRIAAREARKKHTKVFYLVHGYHFFKGAPKKNWLAYPVEKLLAPQCDAMGMINWEDYHFTQKHMPRKKVYHIDGIGLYTKKFTETRIDRDQKRSELGLKPDEIAVLSVGELQNRKNHEPMLRAIASLNNKRIKYIICGWGELKEHLLKVAADIGMKDQFVLLGHRYDIPEILKAVDIFAHPSQREGLGIAAIEAMASGLPLVTSNAQGMKDYVVNGKNGFLCSPNDVKGYAEGLKQLVESPDRRRAIGGENVFAAKKYDYENTKEQILSILMSVLSTNEV